MTLSGVLVTEHKEKAGMGVIRVMAQRKYDL